MILTIRTDNPDAELGLFADDGEQLVYKKWQAHRKLAETLHLQIASNLQFISKKVSDLTGVIVYQGPGSFTGLRIGLSVANALAYSSSIPIVAVSGDTWLEDGIKQVVSTKPGKYVVPLYGADVRVTKPKK